jgi:hypothetical protein
MLPLLKKEDVLPLVMEQLFPTAIRGFVQAKSKRAEKKLR